MIGVGTGHCVARPIAATVTLSCPVGGCAIVSALYGHVGSLECGVVRRRRPSINGKALHLRVAQIPSDERARFIELSFRRPVAPDLSVKHPLIFEL
jgi:hypothetical protein